MCYRYKDKTIIYKEEGKVSIVLIGALTTKAIMIIIIPCRRYQPKEGQAPIQTYLTFVQLPWYSVIEGMILIHFLIMSLVIAVNVYRYTKI